MRASVHEKDHGEAAGARTPRGSATAAFAVAPAGQDPAFDFSAVRASEKQTVGRRKVQIGQQRTVDVGDPGLVATVHRHDPDVTGVNRVGRGEGDPGQVGREGKAAQPTVTGGNLLDRAAPGRNPEEVCVAPDACGEVDKPPVGRPGRPSRDQIPLGGEVAHPPSVRRVEHEQFRG